MIATAGAIRDSAGGYVLNPLLSDLDVTSFDIITTVGDLDLAPVAGSDVVLLSGSVVMQNTEGVQIDDAGGTPRSVLSVDAGDDVLIGNTNCDDVLISVGGLASAVVIKQTTGRVGIGTTAPDALLHVNETTDAASNEVARFTGNDRATAAHDDEGYFPFYLDNSAGTTHEVARFNWIIHDKTAGTEDGGFSYEVMVNGTLQSVLSCGVNGTSHPQLDLTWDSMSVRWGVDQDFQVYYENSSGDLVFDRRVGSGVLRTTSDTQWEWAKGCNFIVTNVGIGGWDGSSTRYGLYFESTTLFAFCNRGRNGVTEIRANTSTAGAGGEQVIIRCEDNALYLARRGTGCNLSFFNATAVSRRAHIADPSGGATVDAESRTAIDAILLALEEYGLLATS